MYSTKPIVIIFAEADLLSTYLVDQLLQKGCVVVIVSNNPSLWKSGALALSDNPNIVFASTEHVNSLRADYIYVASGLPLPLGRPILTFKETSELISAAANYAVVYRPRVLLALPLLVNSAEQAKKVKFVGENFANINLKKTVYLGDLYGRGMDYLDGRPVSVLFNYIAKQILPVVAEQQLFLLFVPDVVDNIIRFLFSYWSQNEQFALGNDFRPSQLSNNPAYGQMLTTQEAGLPSVGLSTNIPVNPPRVSTPDSIVSVIDWIRLSQQATPAPAPRPVVKTPELNVALPKLSMPSVALPKVTFKKPQVKFSPNLKIKLHKPRFRHKKAIIVVATLLIGWFVLLPFLTLTASLGLIAINYQQFKEGSPPSIKSLETAASLADNSSAGFARLVHVPILGKVFQPLAQRSSLLDRGAGIAVRMARVYQNSSKLVESFLGDDGYDVKSLSEPLALELDALYKEASFLEGEVSTYPRIKKWLEDRHFNLLRTYALHAKNIVATLPEILGSGKRISYLILLQNNTELRPTGGFIGSFALLTLENGHMSDLSVYDVYTADGQLKGHVEPPAPIKNYLGEANWYLRDSNWNPDFAASARQAEWFLEKEMERSVNGVIGLDLEVLKSLMAYSGDIYLPDFGETLTATNVYEKIQYEVESTFFPGSQTKASLLTALTRQLLNKITTQTSKDTPKLAQLMHQNLVNKHIQIYIHSDQAMQALDELSFSGSIKPDSCNQDNCQSVWLGMAEANVGVNKANYYIKRESKLRMQRVGNTLESILEVKITNTSENVGFNLGGRYKAYLRVLSGQNAIFDKIQIIDGVNSRSVEPELYKVADRVEAGTVFEVPQGESRSLRFTWKQPLTIDPLQPGTLNLLWRKQAGTIADPVEVVFEDNASYNMNLERDFRARIDL